MYRATRNCRVGLAVAMASALALVGGESATAAEPAEPGCVGEFISGEASAEDSSFSLQIRFFAKNPELFDLANLGEGIQLLQAGDSAFEACR
jgi:hypothetical protein